MATDTDTNTEISTDIIKNGDEIKKEGRKIVGKQGKCK